MQKFQPMLPSLLLFLAQVPIAWALLYATLGAKEHWNEILGGDEPSISTLLSIRFGLAIPIVTAFICAVVGIISLKKKTLFLWFLFITATCEAVVIALLALGLVLPSLKIMYRLGDINNLNTVTPIGLENCQNCETTEVIMKFTKSNIFPIGSSYVIL